MLCLLLIITTNSQPGALLIISLKNPFQNQNLFKIIAVGVVSDKSLTHSSLIEAEKALEIHTLIVNLTMIGIG